MKRKKLIKAAFSGLLAGAALYSFNNYISERATRKNILSNVKGKFYKWKDYGDIFYKVSGSGSPLLILHNLDPSNSSFEFDELSSLLSNKYTVYSVDFPGCGRSCKPKVKYVSYFYIQFIKDFIRDVIKTKPVHILASDYSSSLAVLTAYNAPEMVSNIILLNPASVSKIESMPSKLSQILSKAIWLPVLGETLYHLRYGFSFIDKIFRYRYHFLSRSFSRRQGEAFVEAANTGGSDGRFLSGSVTGKWLISNVTNALTCLNYPKYDHVNIKVFYGERCAYAKSASEEYKKLCKKIEVKPLYGIGEYPHIERPTQIANQI